MSVRPAFVVAARAAAHGRIPQRLARLLALAALFIALIACGGAAPASPVDPLSAMREAAAKSTNGEVVGRWLLGELLVPGGQAAQATRARAQLDALRPKAAGMFASLARAVDDEAHGRFQSAAAAHLDALVAARQSAHPDAPLVAWFCANHLLALRGSVSGLWDKARDVVEQTIRTPGKIGWRARGELVGWWTTDAFRGDSAPASDAKMESTEGNAKSEAAPSATPPEEKNTPDPDPRALRTSGRRKPADAAAVLHGCIKKARIAGPFGRRILSDNRKHFEAERPGPWPLVFPRDPRQKDAPRILPVERNGCVLRATEASGAGIFYVETFIDLPADREIIMSVQGALAVFVDDVEVLTRDTRHWGIWPRFGSRMRLQGGRHRILARIGGSETSIRVLTANGTPLGVDGSDDPTPPYALKAPERLPDPNALEPFLTALGVAPQPGVPASPPRDVADPIATYLAAYIAHVESQGDVSSVLIDPLVRDVDRATGPTLAMKAIFVEQDPIFPETVARDEMKDLRAKAAAKDPELWWPRFWLALDEADKVGVPEVAPKLVALANHFKEVPDIWKGLATVYGRMGWRAEHARAVKDTAARFPDDEGALTALLQLLEEQGNIAEADKVAERLRKLDPTSEIDFNRALARRDYRAAILELRKIAARRADRKDIALRIADLLTRAGAAGEAPIQKLEEALKKKPEDASTRLSLADARFAAGDKGALRQALVDAIQTGSDDGRLREAIELLEGTSELSPFRRDGRAIIREFEASGQTMPGTAARVLDYSALWVHQDGSSRMLEHQIIAIQSREAIQQHAEQRVPRGLVLKLRTVKRDGRTLEPEFVQGKPTVTMPHL
jgi:predicted Zn-dependent protease